MAATPHGIFLSLIYYPKHLGVFLSAADETALTIHLPGLFFGGFATGPWQILIQYPWSIYIYSKGSASMYSNAGPSLYPSPDGLARLS